MTPSRRRSPERTRQLHRPWGPSWTRNDRSRHTLNSDKRPRHRTGRVHRRPYWSTSAVGRVHSTWRSHPSVTHRTDAGPQSPPTRVRWCWSRTEPVLSPLPPPPDATSYSYHSIGGQAGRPALRIRCTTSIRLPRECIRARTKTRQVLSSTGHCADGKLPQHAVSAFISGQGAFADAVGERLEFLSEPGGARPICGANQV
jgi:hypothetical protein